LASLFDSIVSIIVPLLLKSAPKKPPLLLSEAVCYNVLNVFVAANPPKLKSLIYYY
jgi:hypothetical protein